MMDDMKLRCSGMWDQGMEMGMDGLGFAGCGTAAGAQDKLLDLCNKGYPAENEWQLWCQCHNKLTSTC